MNEPLDAALDYAARGWPVFPLHGIVNGSCTCGRKCSSPGKHPLVRRGLHQATTEIAQIEIWWQQWPHANIAVTTGSISGIVVVDIDIPRAFASLDRVIHKLPRTLTGLTGGGGLHLLYRRAGDNQLRNHTSSLIQPENGPAAASPGCEGSGPRDANLARLRNHTGSLPGISGELPGIDLRADGGYIVAPPSRHISGSSYSWLDSEIPIAQAPDWLREVPRRVVAIAPAPGSFTGNGTPYGLMVLRDQLDILRAAKVGERNHTLNRCAFIIGKLIAAGHLLEPPARAELIRVALSIGLTDWETTRTIASAFRSSTTSAISLDDS